MVHFSIKSRNTSLQKRKQLNLFLALVLLSVPLQNFAKNLDLTSSAEKRKTVISGVLNPPSISVNGTEIKQTPAIYSSLVVNNEEIKTNDLGGLKTFYAVLEGDQIKLQWKTPKGQLIPILEISYPAVTKMELKHTHFVIQFNEKTKKAKYDGEELDVNNPNVKIQSTSEWIKNPHTLELYSEENVSRIYNLDFSQHKTDLLTAKSWSVFLGDAPFSSNERTSALGVSSRILNEQNKSHELYAGVAKAYYGLGYGPPYSNYVTQQTFEIKYRYGYNPFPTNSGDNDYRRVTLGGHFALINYKRQSDYATWFDGYESDKADTWFHQGGGFVRWEPLQYGNFGFSFTFDLRFYRSTHSISSNSDTKSFGISYYFDPAVLRSLTPRQSQ